MGTELTLNGVIEGVFPLGARFSLAARGFGGPALLMPGGELKDTLDHIQSGCASHSTSTVKVTCDVNKGPLLGVDYGGGVGVLLALDALRLRTDMIVQGYTQKTVDADIRGSNGSSSESVTLTQSLSGLRYWLTFGVEF